MTEADVLLPLPTLYIPDNDFGIKRGHYRHREIVALLRQFKTNPEAIQFIADMME